MYYFSKRKVAVEFGADGQGSLVLPAGQKIAGSLSPPRLSAEERMRIEQFDDSAYTSGRLSMFD